MEVSSVELITYKKKRLPKVFQNGEDKEHLISRV